MELKNYQKQKDLSVLTKTYAESCEQLIKRLKRERDRGARSKNAEHKI